MAMTVTIEQLTGAGPTATRVDNQSAPAFLFNREDTRVGTTPVPTPTATGTNFSFVKSFQPNITVTDSLSMTNIRVGKVTNEALTGVRLWANTTNSAYTQATTPPSAGADNNITPPTINGDVAEALELITVPPAVYAAGPFNTTGRKGNIVELCIGVDNTNTSSGQQTMPSIRWTWNES